MSGGGRDYYSKKEVRAILSRISDADRVRLRRIVHFQAKKLRDKDPDDLLSEGLTRVLEGTRQWPRGLELGTFFCKMFGSIVSSEAKHAALARKFEIDAEVDRDGQTVNSGHMQPQDTSDQVQDSAYAQEMLDRLMVALSYDQEALSVAMSQAEGLTAIEAQKQFSLTAKKYDAARKRLHRALKKLTSLEEGS